MNHALRMVVIGFALVACAAAARAEVVHTIWEVEPPKNVSQVTAKKGEAFFNQRLLPIRMVGPLNQRSREQFRRERCFILSTMILSKSAFAR